MNKKYLFSEISEHKVWENIEIWQKLIDTALDTKIKEIRENAERQKKRLAERRANLKKNEIPAYYEFSRKKTTDEEDYNKMLSSSVAGVLQQFTGYFSSYKVDLLKAKQLIRKYGKRYKVDTKKLFEMEIELQIPRKSLEFDKNLLRKSVIKKKQEKYNENIKKINGKILLIFKSAIPFCDNLILRNLLALNRNTYEILKIKIFKHILITKNIPISMSNRLKIWSQIINLVFLIN